MSEARRERVRELIRTVRRQSNDEALRLFYRAIELDPDFASAYGMAAMCFHWRKVNGWIADPQEVAEAERLGRRAVELGPDDAVALSGGGYALVFVAHDLNDGPAFIERALALNPNLAWALFSSGWTKAFLGDPEGAIAQLTHAIQLSPLDPHGFPGEGRDCFRSLSRRPLRGSNHMGGSLVATAPNLSGRHSRISGG